MTQKPTYEELERRISELERETVRYKQVEETLQQEKVFYENLIETAQIIILVLDRKGKIVCFNPYLEEISGYRLEEVRGKDWFSTFLPEQDYDHIRKLFQKAVSDIQTRGNINPIFTKDGQKLFIEWYDKTLKDADGSVIGLIATGQDITERKFAEELLRESEEKYRSLTETVVDMIFTLDTEGRFTYLNPEFKRVTGYVAEDFMGRSFTEILPPEYIESTVGIFKRGISGEPTPVYEVELKHKDGKSVPVEVNVTTLKSADGTPTGRIGIARDITERKRSEDKIKNSLKEKEVLLQEIHHRVKNNMQIISSLLNLQSDYVKDKESLEMFNESRNRIFSMASVHEKLYRSKDLTKIDFDDYIRSIIRHLFHTYAVDPNTVRLNVSCSDVFLDINKAVPCGLIINELISNALKHAFPEGRKGELGVDFYPDGDNRLTLSVIDNGKGLPEDFDVSSSKTLGLHLVRTLVTQLKGTMEIERDGGTVFRITFYN